MLLMQPYFIVDSIFISLQFFITVPVILSILRYAKMFEIYGFTVLPENKIRCVRLSCIRKVVWINRLIFIINFIQIKKIGNLYFLMRTQNFILGT